MPDRDVASMSVLLPSDPDPITRKAAELLAREIERRTGARPRIAEGASPQPNDVLLELADGHGPEGFSLRTGAGAARVLAGGPRGLLYGVGRLLRAARFSAGGVAWGPDEGPNEPASALRGIYFATHFGNYYDRAPVEEVVRYIEELALWGSNAFMAWFDMHHFDGIDDPAAQKHLARLKCLHEAARGVGMRVGLPVIANEAYRTSPVELRADGNTGRGHYGVEICPSKPGGMEMILDGIRREFEQFEHLDLLWIWPYDQGGCACPDCRPWGANGFLRAAREIATLYRSRWPQGEVILSTWLFDFPHDQGEWRGLYEALEKDAGWVDALLADGHNAFPRRPLVHRPPAGLPLVNFPEISMQGMHPWGGFGVNPRPAHWQRMADLVRGHVRGGFPYSEGIYEDINKAVWAQLYWNPERSVLDIMKEYAAYEFSPDAAGEIVDILAHMEETLHRFEFEIRNLLGSCDAWESLKVIDGTLPRWAREGWRWRLVALRALIDAQLEIHYGRPDKAVREAFAEITRIYHAEDAEPQVKPPVTDAP